MSVGFPASAKLNQWCYAVSQVFGGQCYLVGSAVSQKNTRDVDVVCIVDDDLFEHWCGPDAIPCHWEQNWRWAGFCIAFSEWGRAATGLNIDFKLQYTSYANEKHTGHRDYQGGMIAGCYWQNGEWHRYDDPAAVV